MPEALKRHLQDWVRRKEQMLPSGFSMTIVAAIDTTMAESAASLLCSVRYPSGRSC